jgi:hypothetical protein
MEHIILKLLKNSTWNTLFCEFVRKICILINIYMLIFLMYLLYSIRNTHLYIFYIHIIRIITFQNPAVNTITVLK